MEISCGSPSNFKSKERKSLKRKIWCGFEKQFVFCFVLFFVLFFVLLHFKMEAIRYCANLRELLEKGIVEDVASSNRRLVFVSSVTTVHDTLTVFLSFFLCSKKEKGMRKREKERERKKKE